MFAFTNLYNLAIDRSLHLSTFPRRPVCVFFVETFFTFPSPSIAFNRNLYTYVVHFLIILLFERQDPAGQPITPIARLAEYSRVQAVLSRLSLSKALTRLPDGEDCIVCPCR